MLNWTTDTIQVPKELNGWARINFNNGDYEGEFLNGKPHGDKKIKIKTPTASPVVIMVVYPRGRVQKGVLYFTCHAWLLYMKQAKVVPSGASSKACTLLNSTLLIIHMKQGMVVHTGTSFKNNLYSTLLIIYMKQGIFVPTGTSLKKKLFQLYCPDPTHETGYGRTHWDEFKMAYHGEMEEQHMHGEGTFFFSNGDMLEGSFEGHKPKGPGVRQPKKKLSLGLFSFFICLFIGLFWHWCIHQVFTELKTGKRYAVEYDGSKKLSEGAVPVVKMLFEQPLQVFLLG